MWDDDLLRLDNMFTKLICKFPLGKVIFQISKGDDAFTIRDNSLDEVLKGAYVPRPRPIFYGAAHIRCEADVFSSRFGFIFQEMIC